MGAPKIKGIKDSLEKAFERSYHFKCKGNPEKVSDLLEDAVDVLLRVYKNGSVNVHCYYFSKFTGNCLHSKDGKRECIYYSIE
jgi:hypothetical protein